MAGTCTILLCPFVPVGAACPNESAQQGCVYIFSLMPLRSSHQLTG
jgi:hypothetical protein